MTNPKPITSIVKKIDSAIVPKETPLPAKIESQNEFNISSLLPSAGTLETTKEQQDILFAIVDDEAVEIRPDGLIYLPWMEYVTRLQKVFNTTWALIPQGMPKKEGNLILWGFYLIIKGKLMGFAVGQQEYYANNPTMTWGDATEGAKSNALMRLCKGIGIGLELWKPSFVRNWKAKYAETYYDTKKNKNLWKRKGRATPITYAPDSAKPKDKPKNWKAEWIEKYGLIKKLIGDAGYYAVLKKYGYSKCNEIPNSGEYIIIEKILKEVFNNKKEVEKEKLKDK